MDYTLNYKLHDFLPLYNNISTRAFDVDINSLKEFVQYKLPRIEAFPQHPGDLMLHQRIISNFMNPNTKYDGLLLIHEMGTGKTCTAVGVAERFISNTYTPYPHTTVKKIVVLTKGKGLQNNFIHEIANVCTSGQYLQGLDRFIKNRNKRIQKRVKVKYTFDTFEIFAKNLQKMSSKEKTLTYENTLFIVDEAHNLRLSSDIEEQNIYTEVANLFKLLKTRKVLLLTGTPMKDQPEEIINLLNLFLRNNLTLEDLNNLNIFKQKIKGSISYLRSMVSDVHRIEEGELMGDLNHFKVYSVVMNSFQRKVYLKAKQKDDDERSIFNNSRQASSFVFPDGSYGKEGFEKYVVATSSGYKFISNIGAEIQTQLNKYSIKYADLIKKLEEDYSNGRLSFVFSEFVKGSGLIVLSILLELNGYQRADDASNFSRPHKRYVIFTNNTSTTAQTRKLIDVFNNPKNVKGEYISVILGSRVIMEGFSFKNIQSEYILTPHWNYSETSQIIARGLRVGSHTDLLKTGITPVFKIYHYVALPNADNSMDSIDLHMYEISEKKDYAIQKVMRTLKEAAFDCELNKDRNKVTDINMDFTRVCEYQRCDYSCDNTFDIDRVEINPRNYQLLYFRFSGEYYLLKNFIIKQIIKGPVTIEDLIKQSGYSNFEIITVFKDMVKSKEVLFTHPEGSYYLKNFNNLWFASTKTEEGDPYLLDFYRKYISVFMGKSIDELIYINQQNFMVDLVNKIFSSKNLLQLQENVVQLPLYLQEKLLCYSISTMDQNTPNNFVRDMVLNNYRLYYATTTSKSYVWLDPERPKCTTNQQYWRICGINEQEQINQIKSDRQPSVENPYGYVGLLNRTSNDFCLKKVDENHQSDKRKKNVGKRCQNWKKKDLVDLVSNRLKVKPDDDFAFDESDVARMKKDPKFKNIIESNGSLKDYKRLAFWNAQDINYLCTKIMQKFLDKKLVTDNPNCGTSRKVR